MIKWDKARPLHDFGKAQTKAGHCATHNVPNPSLLVGKRSDCSFFAMYSFSSFQLSLPVDEIH